MYDMNQMRIQNKQLKLDLQAEQDTVVQLRKRLNAADKQKLEATSRFNKEVASLENQLAKVRAQVEKGEASRHNLEFELTKTQRELSQQKQQQALREASQQDATDELRQKISDLNDELKAAQQQVQKTRTDAQEQEQKLRSEIMERDQEAAKLQAELDVCRNERDRMAAVCNQQEATINDFGEKVHEFECEHRNQSDDLRRAMSEIKFCKEREDRLKKDLESALGKIKSLEESVEAERAAHLETKFNSEIVQLRVRDLEGGLEVEKSANAEGNRAVERLTNKSGDFAHLGELEQMYDEERKVKKDLMNKLDKLEKEYLGTRRQLSGEVEEKKTVIGSLSKELEVHQKNFNELKTELGKAKKRQAFLEETYGTAFKELEFLLMNFDFDEKGKKTRLTAKKEDTKPKKTVPPAAAVESVKQLLTNYRRRLDNVTEELSKSKKSCEKLTKEVDSCKEMIKSKDKSLEEAHKNYTRTAKELNKMRANYGEVEAMMGKLRSSLENTTSSQGKDRNRIQELSEEVCRLRKWRSFMGCIKRLLAGRVLVSQYENKPLNQFSWSDLTEMVYEQVANTVDALQRAEEKLKSLTDNLKSRDEVVAELQNQHEEQLSRLTTLAREQKSGNGGPGMGKDARHGNALASQRHLLEEQMIVWDNCRERAQYLVNVLNTEMTQVPQWNIEHFVAAARSSFSKLMDHMAQFFPTVRLQPTAGLRDRRSLAGRLGRTLARTLQGKSVAEKDFLVSSQELLIALQNHILDFTQRLHTVGRTDLRRKEQELKQSRKQIMQFEFQRKSLQANLRDAEDALRTAAKDKEILAQYIKAVEAALEEAKKKLVFPKDGGSSSEATITMSKLLLNADLHSGLTFGKAGPELIACQNLVGVFVDVHHQSLARVRTLEEETASLRQHVNSLKRELSDAVHREFNEQTDLPTRDDYDLTPSVSQSDISGKEEFRPLREDSEVSYSAPSLSGSPEKPGTKSAFKAVRNSE
nr:hypothetical protein BaRGS_026721 [Batillaria attramentaria]